jgi:hypothetical protein
MVAETQRGQRDRRPGPVRTDSRLDCLAVSALAPISTVTETVNPGPALLPEIVGAFQDSPGYTVAERVWSSASSPMGEPATAFVVPLTCRDASFVNASGPLA